MQKRCSIHSFFVEWVNRQNKCSPPWLHYPLLLTFSYYLVAVFLLTLFFFPPPRCFNLVSGNQDTWLLCLLSPLLLKQPAWLLWQQEDVFFLPTDQDHSLLLWNRLEVSWHNFFSFAIVFFLTLSTHSNPHPPFLNVLEACWIIIINIHMLKYL